MDSRLLQIKREAKELGINTNNFKVTRDSMGEYTITQQGNCLAQGYDITECRIYAIETLIENESKWQSCNQEREEVVIKEQEPTIDAEEQFRQNDLKAIKALIESGNSSEYVIGQIKIMMGAY